MPRSTSSRSSRSSDSDLANRFEALGHDENQHIKAPFHARQHGNDIVHIEVGSGEETHEFSIHRDLLTKASAYFERALRRIPVDPHATLELPGHDSDAFEVVYQYLYTGHLQSESYYNIEGDKDTFWLRAFRTAIFTTLPDLITSIYDVFLQKLFPQDNGLAFEPSQDFVHELFTGSSPVGIKQLRNFIITKTAYRIVFVRLSDWDASEWNDIFEAETDFAMKVLKKVSSFRARAPADRPKNPNTWKRFATYGGA